MPVATTAQHTTQMNTRIDRDLKAQGDAALASIGLSASEAVRLLWKKASKRGKDLQEVASLLVEESRDAEADSVSEKLAVARRGWELVPSFFESRGGRRAEGVPNEPLVDDKELLAEAMFERLVERGLA